MGVYISFKDGEDDIYVGFALGQTSGLFRCAQDAQTFIDIVEGQINIRSEFAYKQMTYAEHTITQPNHALDIFVVHKDQKVMGVAHSVKRAMQIALGGMGTDVESTEYDYRPGGDGRGGPP
jgi:hypothetical protein